MLLRFLKIALSLAVLLSVSVAMGQEAAPEAPPEEPAAEAPPLPPNPALGARPRQVIVSVKVVEFQAQRGVETGLRAFFQRVAREGQYGSVDVSEGVRTAVLNVLPSAPPTITVLLDSIGLDSGQLDITLQALVNQSRAFVLSRPKLIAMVPDEPGAPAVPAQLSLGTRVPYESATVVGNTAILTTRWIDTGVNLTVNVLDVIDDDGNWRTTDDQYVLLNIDASVKDVGANIPVVLSPELTGGATANQILVPETLDRKIETTVYVRHGQVLVLGGLFRNERITSLATAPWLSNAENIAVGAAERVLPSGYIGSPVTSTLGNRADSEGRRELVFLIKAESWRQTYTVAETGFGIEEREEPRKRPQDLITDVLTGIADIPQGIAEGIAGPGDGVRSTLGEGN